MNTKQHTATIVAAQAIRSLIITNIAASGATRRISAHLTVTNQMSEKIERLLRQHINQLANELQAEALSKAGTAFAERS